MPLVDVAGSEDVPEGGKAQFRIGDDQIMVCRIGGVLHAVHAVCPHRGAFLTQGTLQDNVITCPWHAWSYDVTTGEGITNPMSCVRKYEVKEANGRISIEV